MAERNDAGRPRIIKLDDWFNERETGRIYGRTEEGSYITSSYDIHADNKFNEGGRVVSFMGTQFILGTPLGRL